jgi:two-component system sensor histidine kinase DegS
VEVAPTPLMNRVKGFVLSPSFWLVTAMLLSGLLLHYSAQQRLLSIPALGRLELTRHSTERVLLILPIGYGAFALGPTAGLVALGIAVLIMLPRVVFLSSHPVDAFIETVAVALVGGLTVWLAWIRQDREILRDKATARLRAINAVSAALAGSVEPRQLLGEALDRVLEETGLEAGLILVLDERGEDLIVAARRGLLTGLVGGASGLRLARMLVGDPALASQVALPLKSSGRLQGALIVGKSRSYRFLPDEMDLLAAIASQIGAATERARLHQDVALQLEREKRLAEVAKEITSQLELDKVLSRVVQIAEKLVNGDAAVIGLLDEGNDVITYPHLHNLPKELERVTVPRGEGLAGRVIATGTPDLIADYPAYPGRVKEFVEGGVKSVLAVPMVSGGRVFGALGVVTLDGERTFSDRDMTVLSGVARQAAIAIENARLFESARSYARQILTAQEEERKRIARELHDDTVQALVALSLQHEALLSADYRTPEPVKQRLEELRQLTAEITRTVRRFSQDLRPSMLDDLGLLPTLEGLNAKLLEETAIEVELKVLGDDQRLSPATELVMFRIVQEALANVRKHSRATKVVTTVEIGDAVVRVTVRDNGCGFRVPDRSGTLVEEGKLGLTGMFERAQLLGGTVTVRSRSGEGTTVVAEIPLPA